MSGYILTRRGTRNNHAAHLAVMPKMFVAQCHQALDMGDHLQLALLLLGEQSFAPFQLLDAFELLLATLGGRQSIAKAFTL